MSTSQNLRNIVCLLRIYYSHTAVVVHDHDIWFYFTNGYLLAGSVVVGIGVVVIGAGVLRRTSGSDTNIIDNTMSSIKLCCEQLIESSLEIADKMEIPGSIPS